MQVAKNGISDIHKQVQESDLQHQSTQCQIIGVLDDIDSTTKQTEWIVKDYHQDVSAKLTVIQNDTHSMAGLAGAGVVEILEIMARMEKRMVEFSVKHTIKDVANVGFERLHKQMNNHGEGMTADRFYPRTKSYNPFNQQVLQAGTPCRGSSYEKAHCRR